MKFKKLEIQGFKSFADKIDIPLSAGVTAIVGPNGCGKSNVADAIRWALGEQSAKLLRGGSMQDVIFNGTEKRFSHSFCEVSLHFDNTEKIFKELDYKDVCISRKLFRSNESEYLINKTNVRRSDIIDALRDSGMGREGYSIIGQGRVEELISSKPEERRAIFDEAAGISKFKAKKQEAERRLVRTRDHLERINDILTEKSKQLEPLTRQSETARKFLELSELLKSLEVNIYLHQYETASDIKKQITERRDALSADLLRAQKQYETDNDEYNQAMKTLNEIDEILSAKHKRLLELSVDMQRNAGEAEQHKISIKYLVGSNEKLKSEIEATIEENERAYAVIKEYEATRPQKAGEFELLKRQSNTCEAELSEIIERLAGSVDETKEGHRAMIEAMEKLSDIKANMSSLIAEKKELTRRIIELESRAKRISNANIERDSSILSIKSELDEHKKNLEVSSAKLENNTNQNKNNINRLAELNDELTEITNKHSAAAARQKMLAELKESNSYFEEGVTRLLNSAKMDANIASKIEGVVARIMTVPKAFETAVEVAIGGAMHNIITKTEKEASYLIDHLKKTKMGRVTFFPLSVIRPRTISREFERYLDINGCYGIASKLVKYDEKFSNIVGHLLGGTVIVDTIETAISLAKTTRYAFNIVTLEGDIIKPSGAITGGIRKARISNVFSNERELSELTEVLSEVKGKIATLMREREELSEKQNSVRLENKFLQSSVHSLEIKISNMEHHYNRLISESADANREIGELNAEVLIANKRVDEIDNDVNSVGELERIVQTKRQSVHDDSEIRAKETSELQAKREELGTKLLALKVEITKKEQELTSAATEIQRIIETVEANKNRINQNREHIAVNDEDISTYKAKLEQLAVIVNDSDTDTVATLKNEISGFGATKVKIQEKLKECDEKRNGDFDIINDIQDKKRNEEYQLLKVDTDIEQMQERIAEAYKMEYNDCLPFRDAEFEISQAIEEAGKLKRRIERLQPVNLEAIEMCEQVYAEYNELEVQRDDLTKAERDLVKMIEDLSKEMRVIFRDKFIAINANFKQVFKELFDGGNAELVLQQGEGITELEAGVEIIAQPPQKKLQILTLLSGGEKALTAIAILFAILKLRPMPFCVLDEIEAALDDANAMRFAKYLRRFSKDTQFIVITHRKPTMELADSLYGVTMQEKGISRVVSVKLSEAVTMSA